MRKARELNAAATAAQVPPTGTAGMERATDGKGFDISRTDRFTAAGVLGRMDYNDMRRKTE